MTPRLALVAFHVPAHVTDQAVADALWRTVRMSIQPGESGLVFPDAKSLEVNVRTLTVEQDAEFRATLGRRP